MRIAVLVVAAGLAGCQGRPADPEPPRPAGDTGPPAEEFRQAHDTAASLGRRLRAMRAESGGQPLGEPFLESVPLAKAHSAARREAGRLGYEVGVAEPHTPLGADALFACLLFSLDPMDRRRHALDLAVQHHPDDPRLGEYLTTAFADRPPAWLPAVLDRVLASTRHPGVRAVASAARDRLPVGGLGSGRVRLAP